jgi:hypothetical protein
MIDCLAAFIAFLGADADLNTQTAGRIAAKHKFGMVEAGGWPTPSKALQLTYDGGGTPDVNAGMERARLEARCYGGSQAEANQVYARLMAICEAFQRATVSTGDGTALLYYFVPDTSGQHDREPLGDLGVDMVRVFVKAAAHHESV